MAGGSTTENCSPSSVLGVAVGEGGLLMNIDCGGVWLGCGVVGMVLCCFMVGFLV